MNPIQELVAKQHQFFHTQQTKHVAFRIEALQNLRNAIILHEQQIYEALQADLHKSQFESYSTEIGIVLEEIRYICKHLQNWVKPKRVKTALTHFGSKGYLYPEPYGVTLIIAPWNYPFQLALLPLIGAIAAGNCAVVKPSELTPRTSNLIRRLIEQTFPAEFICVVEGGIEVSNQLLAEKFDYIFFTGSVPVGRVIMEAASKHLTPITLELGGKSPCIVHRDANLRLAAKRIVWGKFLNAGQTCVAPDYLLVDSSVKQELIRQLKTFIQELYPDALHNSDYTHIVNKRHFERLLGYLDEKKVIHGGNTSPSTLAIEPTLLDNVTWQDPVMQNEIFGPILPILTYDDLAEAISKVNAQPKPLALYLFTENKETQKQVLSHLSFGGGCINDTVFHIATPYLPFGGVGNSGIGSYHGKGSFEIFSHQKSVLKQTTLFDIPVRYHTTKQALKKMKWFFK
ncbi:aldehyde dehydrogenase [Brevibacillus sp. 7WMA2]|uniref:aldehyde dehydrogenase n=1 Tax=Brevibacillus TaxID=55080 RepID=UPI0013A77766|nr:MULTISPECIES: aldehyde dehydrogenase [Brevibacillus]MCR8995998.1 aldehyde dehydrogenase [Brevibacillus laterosporus]QIC06819.1 aldehyde dehydrogenase [Brevibacillus sp. 7WMA2]